MATFLAAWLFIGVPVAALIAAIRVFVFVITALPEMAATAIVLGAVQGTWFFLSGFPPPPESRAHRWFGAMSGGVLGLMGFPPVYSRSNVVPDGWMVLIFLLAAICGGIVAGFTATTIAALPVRPRSLGRDALVAALVLLPLAGIDARYFWGPMADRLPVPPVSRAQLMNLAPGDASGSAWTGCYQYQGQFSRGSGVIGGEGGLLTIAQSDGALQLRDGSILLRGGVDTNGRFRAGLETASGGENLRIMWEGKFGGQSLEFEKRMTLVRGNRVVNTTRAIGAGQRIACNP